MDAPNLEKQRVFLAGATGLAGSAILRRLLDTAPTVLVRAAWHETKPLIKHERLEWVRADLTRLEDCRRAARGCDSAVLAAANTGGAASAQDEPERQVTQNLVMDARCLEALFLEGVGRAIFISTAVVYQEMEGPVSEDDLDLGREPHDAYFGVAWAKRAAEKLCRFWHLKKGLETVVLRAANIYGPFAKFDPGRANFIPAIIRKAEDGMDPFVVWGNPKVRRDVIYADDFAEAVVKALGRTDIHWEVFNLGTGDTVSVGEVVEYACQSAGHRPGAIEYDRSQPTTIKARFLDCTKIMRELDWQPEFSHQQGIDQTAKWWRENREWWNK